MIIENRREKREKGLEHKTGEEHCTVRGQQSEQENDQKHERERDQQTENRILIPFKTHETHHHPNTT